MAYTNGHGSQQVDFDLHGLAGIRLVNAAPHDVAAVARQLGPIQAPLKGQPDIIVRFVDRLTIPSGLRYLGVDEAGFTDDAFLVLRSKHGAHAKVQIDFTQVGKQCEIVCETGLPAVPLLIPILNLTVLSKGALPLHASAFTYNGTGVLTTGWSKGGKTETLLAFMSRGAEYIGDEWVYISADGQHMYGIPEPIRVWDWHLSYLPHYRPLVRWDDRFRLRTIKIVQAMARAMPRGSEHASLPIQAMRRIQPVLKRQLHVDMHPQKLFGSGFGALKGSLQKVIFIASHASQAVTVDRMDPQEIARRMVFSLQYERLPFMAFYMMFRFVFPDRANALIEEAEERQRETLLRVLADKDAYAVYHPYPVPIPSLFDAISQILR
jgi:hypothetical protein